MAPSHRTARGSSGVVSTGMSNTWIRLPSTSRAAAAPIVSTIATDPMATPPRNAREDAACQPCVVTVGFRFGRSPPPSMTNATVRPASRGARTPGCLSQAMAIPAPGSRTVRRPATSSETRPPLVGHVLVVPAHDESVGGRAVDDAVDDERAGTRLTLGHAERDDVADVVALRLVEHDEVAGLQRRQHADATDEQVAGRSAQRRGSQRDEPRGGEGDDERQPENLADHGSHGFSGVGGTRSTGPTATLLEG